MSIYKPTVLREFLESIGASPKKSLSQNFLIDGNILRKIISTANVQPGDIVLEIGPGPGSLTELLLTAGARVIAVEQDNVLAKALERFKNPTNELHIFNQDIRTFELANEVEKLFGKGQKVKVIANLPYHLTTPILVALVPQHQLITSLIVMVQHEVGQRMAADETSDEYGSLSVFLKFYCDPTYAFTVSNQCFYPVPRVKSAVVKLDLHEPLLKENHDQFFIMTRTAFEHRRKMLKASLRDLVPPEKTMSVLESLGLNPLARPEELSLNDFLNIFNRLFSI